MNDETQLDQWQESEHEEPTTVIDKNGNPKRGTRTVKERFAYTRLIPRTICEPDAHFYEPVDGGRRQNGQVLVKCRHCPVGRQFIVGRMKLADGKLTTL